MSQLQKGQRLIWVFCWSNRLYYKHPILNKVSPCPSPQEASGLVKRLLVD